MRWRKLGLLYQPDGPHPKLASHAANPVAIHLEGDLYRVFFSGRDVQNRSSVGFADVDLYARTVVRACKEPVFEHGPEGTFYSHGVSIGNCYEVQGKRYIGFMGWQRPEEEHWRGDIGCVRLNDNLTMELESGKPLLTRDDTDSISLSYPWVLKRGDDFVMWYGSTLTWDAGNGEMLHVIKAATSTDGLKWNCRGLAVPYELGNAQAFSRPTVFVNSMGYHMWFSYRGGQPGRQYRIGYAYSVSGRDWELRLEQAGIDVSSSGWDSEMIEYPFVFSHKGNQYMLYNGNDYGRTGFGAAVLEA